MTAPAAVATKALLLSGLDVNDMEAPWLGIAGSAIVMINIGAVKKARRDGTTRAG
jgi:hypothetical protein